MMTKVFFCDASNVLNLAICLDVCTARTEYINTISDQKRRNQSLLAWRLLEYALEREYALKILSANVNERGKWSVDGFNGDFSISHSNDIIAVAISNSSVGIDVEMVSDKILKLSKKYKTCDVNELTRIWADKESLFKHGKDSNVVNHNLLLGNNQYVFSVASNDLDVKFEQIDIKKIIA